MSGGFSVVEIAGLESLKINIGVMDGRIFEFINVPLQVEIKAARFRAGNVYVAFPGACGQTVVDDATNYFWLDAAGMLMSSVVGWPSTTHMRLGRVIAAGGHITNIYDDRAFLSINAPSVSKGAGNPNGIVNGVFGELYQDTVSGIWYTCASDPGGNVWDVT